MAMLFRPRCIPLSLPGSRSLTCSPLHFWNHRCQQLLCNATCLQLDGHPKWDGDHGLEVLQCASPGKKGPAHMRASATTGIFVHPVWQHPTKPQSAHKLQQPLLGPKLPIHSPSLVPSAVTLNYEIKHLNTIMHS